jgi:hypothetical protein
MKWINEFNQRHFDKNNWEKLRHDHPIAMALSKDTEAHTQTSKMHQ